MVPATYAPVLREPLKGILHTAEKLVAARSTLSKWSDHKASGTYPPHIKQTAPVLQFSKDFKGSANANAGQSLLTKAHSDYLTAALDASISAKKDEVSFLQDALGQDALTAALTSPIIHHYELNVKSRRIPEWKDLPNGEVVLDSWKPSPQDAVDFKVMLSTVVLYAFRIVQIVEAKELTKKDKSDKKKKLAKDADVEMADATKPGPSLQSLVDKAVSARLRKLEKPKGELPVFSLTVKHSRRSRQRKAKEQKRFSQEGSSLFSGTVSPTTSWQTSSLIRRYQDEEIDEHQPPQALPEASRKGESQRQEGNQEGQESSQVDGEYLYGFPSTIPDFVLDLPYPDAISWLITRTPVNIITASQYKSFVHCSPGVNLPLEIAQNLSVGLKYLTYQPINPQLIREAYVDFRRRLKWRLKFLFENDGEDEFYDPDYDVSPPSKKEPPVLPFYLEKGLQRGLYFVDQTIAKIPVEDQGPTLFKPFNPPARLIKEFLINNNYIVTNTDKNLGLAVSERTWIYEKSLELLHNPVDYKPLSPSECSRILTEKCTAMQSLSDSASLIPWTGNLDSFLKSKITPTGLSHKVPKFYGIPKIHKTPVKMRPIIPCHSAIMNPAAKYISKQLKPIIQSAPTIIHGTKDLAIKLSKLKINPSRRWYIVTGDVVAFYPNIPLELCMFYVTQLWEEYRQQNLPAYKSMFPDSIERERELFRAALNVGNVNLVTEFDGKAYLQLRGLAMGVADSPDLANLYGYWHERQAGIMSHEDILFYGRYIDDCLAIVYAPSEQEAIAIVSNLIKFDGCTIEWSASDHYAHFLDMTLYRDDKRLVQWCPYRKPGNHMERIPWISHHPIDVKRGTFLGEMTRLAVLSSTRDTYVKAIQELVSLYVHRGYPSRLVKSWLKDNITKRWDSWFLIRDYDSQPEVLVLKTEFNLAWNYFNAKELSDVVFGYWREWLERAESGRLNLEFPAPQAISNWSDGLGGSRLTLRVGAPGHEDVWIEDLRKLDILNRKLIVSRKRTRNLLDLSSLWKKTILEKLDEDVADDIASAVSVAPPVEPPPPRYLQMDIDSDEEGLTIHHRRSPPAPRAWRFG